MDFQYSLSIFFITMALDVWFLTQAELFTSITDIEPLLNTQKRIIDNLNDYIAEEEKKIAVLKLFTDIADIDRLLNTLKRTVDYVDDYIAKEEKRIAVLKKHLNCYKKEHILAMKNISDYVGNPINVFTLVKRLTIDLDFIQNNILFNSDYVKNVIAENRDIKFPTFEDLAGAFKGLIRLQETYLLDIGELTEGRLIGRTSRYQELRGSKDYAISTPMTAYDCFGIGQALREEQDFQNSLHWMMESLRKLRSGDDLFNISEVDVLEYIIVNSYILGDIKTAFEWAKELLALDPEYPQKSGKVEYFQKIFKENELKIEQKGETGESINDDRYEQSQTSDSEENDIYKKRYDALCRGEIHIPKEILRRLKCSYLMKNHPFLKLAPIKMEQIYIGPDVFLFHEVMSDEETEHIKNMTKPRMTRVTIFELDSDMEDYSESCISKVALVGDDESEVVAHITQRMADFTGFSMDTAEDLLVTNYGIGGHCEPHLDYEEENKFIDSEGHRIGNRIATVLVYMSDVAQGGATVFTELGLTVLPVKNSALFWNNLLPSGEGNPATMHAACPVLRGSKWESNKWIHELGQEFIKPCVA